MRAAAATADAFGATLDDVRVSVAAEVARTYFELRGLPQQLAVAERSLANQRQTLRLTELRRDAGYGEEFDVASASARVSAIEACTPHGQGLTDQLASRSKRHAAARPQRNTGNTGRAAASSHCRGVAAGCPCSSAPGNPVNP